jgi:dTDP-glucose 4,6-dehydratase
VDNFSTGSLSNLSHLAKNIEILRHDITTPLVVETDVILNFACPASPVQYQRDPVQTLKTNVHGAINMLDLAKRTGALILQASTSEVYGDPEVSPQKESYWGRVNPIGIRSCYDEGKRAAETLFFDYHRQYGVDIRVPRIFNTYGPRMRLNDGRALPAFIGQALRGEDMTVFGDGSQTRSFCYVDDLVEGIYRLLLSDYSSPVNIGNPNEISLKDFAEEVLKLTGNTVKIVYKDLPVDDPKQRQPDITKARTILGWEPKVDRAEGLQKTYDYFKVLPPSEWTKLPKEFISK